MRGECREQLTSVKMSRMGFEVDGIHHLTLNVTDLERSRAFYTGVLGFVPDQDFPGEKLRYRIGPSLGVKSRAELERLVDVLRAAGVATQGIQYDALGPGVVCFRDPDNIAWEFFEQPSGGSVGGEEPGEAELDGGGTGDLA